MASLLFEVLHAFSIDMYRGVVIARQLDPGLFTLTSKSSLGGRALQSRLEVPEGGPSEALAFYLDSIEDLRHFTPGRRVLLADVDIGQQTSEPPAG